MTYTYTFKGLTDEQLNKFYKIIKSIPFDVVAEFDEWADVMGLELVVNESRYITELTVIGA